MSREPRFSIGQRFTPRSGLRHPAERVVVDILRTFNSAGVQVKLRYVAQHRAATGQIIEDCDVCETTIARGLEHAE
jgi:hypothetical protein